MQSAKRLLLTVVGFVAGALAGALPSVLGDDSLAYNDSGNTPCAPRWYATNISKLLTIPWEWEDGHVPAKDYKWVWGYAFLHWSASWTPVLYEEGAQGYGPNHYPTTEYGERNNVDDFRLGRAFWSCDYLILDTSRAWLNRWGLDQASDPDAELNIALHEAGHTIGLRHSDQCPTVMTANYTHGCSGYVPKTDDLCGVNSIYVNDTYTMPSDCHGH